MNENPALSSFSVIGKHRSPIGVWLLSLVTLGIYYVVWWYKINREVGEFDRSIEVSPGMSVLAITLGNLIIVPPIWSTITTGGRIAQAERSAGLSPRCSPLIGFLLWLVVALNTVYYQEHLNAIWERFAPQQTVVPEPSGTPTGSGA